MMRLGQRVRFVIGIVLAVTLIAGTAAGAGKSLQGQGKGKKGKGGTPTPRCLYVWDNTIPGDPAETDALIDFALDKGVTVLFLECSPVGYGLAGAVRDFTDFTYTAHGAGLQVFALNGFPWFGVPDGAGIPGQVTGHSEGWSVYQTVAQSGVPFDGIIDNTEPYLANPAHWWTDTAARAQSYLDWLQGVRDRIGGLPLYSTVPFWYDQDARLDLALDGESQSHPLNWYVARKVDVVNVLAYRDVAGGSDGIVTHASGEMATGPCIVGVETTALGTDPVSDKLSFWEEGEGEMESQLRRVKRSFKSSSNFQGFAIHDYASYLALRP